MEEQEQYSSHYSQFSNWANEREVGGLKDLLGNLSPLPPGINLATLKARRDWASFGAFRVPIASGGSPSTVRWEVRLTSVPAGASLPPEAVEVGAVVLYALMWGDVTISSNRVVAEAAASKASQPSPVGADQMSQGRDSGSSNGGSGGGGGGGGGDKKEEGKPAVQLRELSRRQVRSGGEVYHTLGGPVRVVTAGTSAEAAAILEVVLIPPPGGGVGVMMTGALESNTAPAPAAEAASSSSAPALALRPDLTPAVHALFKDPRSRSTHKGYDDDGDDRDGSSQDGVGQWKGRRRRRVLDASVRNPAALDHFVGGLDEQLTLISRRVLANRGLSPEVAQSLGVANVRGLLLHGPPGCGKTLLARQLAVALEAVEVKVVSGPEVLNKFVGTSEERVRELFAASDAEWHLRGSKSGLHVVILDELDAICRERGSLSGDTSGVRDSVVNQLLAKLDGVRKTGNVLVIGLTNRKELIDDAMLRPGRLEVHVEIGWPDAVGRRQILDVHTRAMLRSGALKREIWLLPPHTKAPDTSDDSGSARRDSSDSWDSSSSSSSDNGSAPPKTDRGGALRGGHIASKGGSGSNGGAGKKGESVVETLVAGTSGFSGAELAGVVRAATSFAVARHFEDEYSVSVSLAPSDFELGLQEVKQQLLPVLRRRRAAQRAMAKQGEQEEKRRQALALWLAEEDDDKGEGENDDEKEEERGGGGLASRAGFWTVRKLLRSVFDSGGSSSNGSSSCAKSGAAAAAVAEYEKALVETHHVRWSELRVMTDDQLRECGVAKVGHRIRILSAVAQARRDEEEEKEEGELAETGPEISTSLAPSVNG